MLCGWIQLELSCGELVAIWSQCKFFGTSIRLNNYYILAVNPYVQLPNTKNTVHVQVRAASLEDRVRIVSIHHAALVQARLTAQLHNLSRPSATSLASCIPQPTWQQSLPPLSPSPSPPPSDSWRRGWQRIFKSATLQGLGHHWGIHDQGCYHICHRRRDRLIGTRRLS